MTDRPEPARVDLPLGHGFVPHGEGGFCNASGDMCHHHNDGGWLDCKQPESAHRPASEPLMGVPEAHGGFDDPPAPAQGSPVGCSPPQAETIIPNRRGTRLDRSKEWWMERARAEGDATIGAASEPEPSPSYWRCEGCGKEFDSYHFSHGRASHALGCNGSCQNCPVEEECGPVSEVPAPAQGSPEASSRPDDDGSASSGAVNRVAPSGGDSGRSLDKYEAMARLLSKARLLLLDMTRSEGDDERTMSGDVWFEEAEQLAAEINNLLVEANRG